MDNASGTGSVADRSDGPRPRIAQGVDEPARPQAARDGGQRRGAGKPAWADGAPGALPRFRTADNRPRTGAPQVPGASRNARPGPDRRDGRGPGVLAATGQ